MKHPGEEISVLIIYEYVVCKERRVLFSVYQMMLQVGGVPSVFMDIGIK